MSIVYIALGSNLQDPCKQLDKAIITLEEHEDIKFIQCSSYYQSTALTLPNTAQQPDYINAVVLLETDLTPKVLLQTLQQIEIDQGRKHGLKWSARVIDLDILLFDQQVINTQQLTIPHKEMQYRNFVLLPLAELDNNIGIPKQGNLSDLLNKLSLDGIIKIKKNI